MFFYFCAKYQTFSKFLADFMAEGEEERDVW